MALKRAGPDTEQLKEESFPPRYGPDLAGPQKMKEETDTVSHGDKACKGRNERAVAIFEKF